MDPSPNTSVEEENHDDQTVETVETVETVDPPDSSVPEPEEVLILCLDGVTYQPYVVFYFGPAEVEVTVDNEISDNASSSPTETADSIPVPESSTEETENTENTIPHEDHNYFNMSGETTETDDEDHSDNVQTERGK